MTNTEYMKKYRRENPEIFKKSQQKWNEKNPGYYKQWYAENKERVLLRFKERMSKPESFLSIKYSQMKRRCNNKKAADAHLYYGKEILPRQEFIEKSLKDTEFLKLFKDWKISNYTIKLCPSPDRQDAEKGYTWDNIKWTTHSENSGRTRRTKNVSL